MPSDILQKLIIWNVIYQCYGVHIFTCYIILMYILFYKDSKIYYSFNFVLIIYFNDQVFLSVS